MINTNNFISKFIIRRRWETGFNCNQGIHSKRNKNSRRDPRAKVHVVKNTLINPTPFVCCMLWNVIGDWYCEHSTNRSVGFSNKRLFYLNFDAMLHFSLLRFNFISWHFATFLAINVGIIWASGQHLEKKTARQNDHGTIQSHKAPLTMSFSLLVLTVSIVLKQSQNWMKPFI